MRVVIEPGREWRFEDLPPDTIALDGAVQGPRVDAAARRFSFDHHAGCIRLVTSATCQQVLDAIVLGLDPSGMDVLLNDLDGDSVLSVWLLENHARWRTAEALRSVRPLVACVAAIDAHGPAYPAPHAELAPTFYRDVMQPAERHAGGGAWPDPLRALHAAIARLEAWYTAGLPPRAASAPAPIEPVVTSYGGWVLAVAPPSSGEIPVAGAAWLYGQGHDRLVLATPVAGGGHRYTLARRSDLVSGFPLDRLYEALNAEESRVAGRSLGAGETWGGGSSIGEDPAPAACSPLRRWRASWPTSSLHGRRSSSLNAREIARRRAQEAPG
jgi:hypothetical protein